MSEHLPLAPQEGAGVAAAIHIPAAPHVFTEQELGEYKEQDRFLPIANVARIMKSSLPPNAKVAKDAKETVQECVSEFISFITSEAAEKCHIEKRKTVVGEDIIYALYSLGFENYAETLKVHLARMRHAGGTAGRRRDVSGDHEREDPSELAALVDKAREEAEAEEELEEEAPVEEEEDVDLDERFAEVVQTGTFAENDDDDM